MNWEPFFTSMKWILGILGWVLTAILLVDWRTRGKQIEELRATIEIIKKRDEKREQKADLQQELSLKIVGILKDEMMMRENQKKVEQIFAPIKKMFDELEDNLTDDTNN